MRTERKQKLFYEFPAVPSDISEMMKGKKAKEMNSLHVDITAIQMADLPKDKDMYLQKTALSDTVLTITGSGVSVPSSVNLYSAVLHTEAVLTTAIQP